MFRGLTAGFFALASLSGTGCGASERSTRGGTQSSRGGAAQNGAGDAGRATSGDTGRSGAPGTGGAGGAGTGGGGAGTTGTSAAGGATFGGNSGGGKPGLGGSAGVPADVGGSAGVAENEGGAANGPGTGLDTTSWSQWSVTPMPNAPGSDLPHIQQYTLGVDAVHDDVTGLTWQRRIQTQYTDPEAAKPYCEGLELDGQGGFRVPRAIELVTLIDYLRGSHAIDGSVFDAGTGEIVISSTKSPYSTLPKYWMVDFANGIPTDDAAPTGVLCVSGGPSGELPEHYEVGTDTVLDRWTGLTWVSGGGAVGYAFADAAAYCAAITLGGAPFRLPSLNELLTVWDFSEIPPVVNESVFDFPPFGSGFWLAPTPRLAPFDGPASLTTGFLLSDNQLNPDAQLLCVR